MSTTLTNGLKLPDKGSVDWYADMQSNYAILDGAVGTVAEHTTALAGKAPAVHTHTKSDITDFPAYGTTAGTICEGNDSRLSDARTPVAHTHGKADITDLFNSANTWTALNSYNQPIQITANFNIGVAPSSDVYGGFNFGNGNTNIGNVTARVSSAGITYSRLYVSNKYANGALDPNGTLTNVELQVGLKANGNRFIYSNASWDNSLVPYDNNTYDLGSSSYQWNNLYSKGYYYNGVAWGLDKANVWTGANTFSGATSCILNFKFGTSGSYNDIRYYDSNNSNYATLRCKTNNIALGLKHSSASAWYDGSSININDNGSVNIKSYNGTDAQLIIFTNNAVYPSVSSVTDLGTTNNKWKTLNGVNPGALSLPNISGADPIDFSQWDVSGAAWTNYYTPSENGWLRITINDRATNSIFVVNGNDISASAYGNGSQITGGTGRLVLLMPVRSGVRYQIIIKANSISDVGKAEFIPCNGNV